MLTTLSRLIAVWAVPTPTDDEDLWGALFRHAMASATPVRSRPAVGREGPDDDVLIAEALDGQQWAYTALYERHVDGVWRRLTRLLGPDPEREDIAQQVFVEVFRRLRLFRGEASFATYLYRVATNAACDRLRRRRRLPAALGIDEETFASELTPERSTVNRQAVLLTWSLLERIKPKKRIAYVLRVVEGLTLEEIAEQVGANVPAVAQRIRHAHQELMAMAERRGLLG